MTDYASEETVFYGIIKKFRGGKKCDVMVVDSDGRTECLSNVRLKGSLQNMRCRQYLNPESLVLVDDGTIVLVYSRESEMVIETKVRRVLRQEDSYEFEQAPVENDEEATVESDTEPMSEEEDDDLDCI